MGSETESEAHQRGRERRWVFERFFSFTGEGEDIWRDTVTHTYSPEKRFYLFIYSALKPFGPFLLKR